MGIYSRKLLESAPALDSVQDPNDVGVDLDQVEKDIAGPDGIESHKEEIEDAVEGVVGEPLEEAYMCMYESEYNYGQLMRVLGVRELREASMGRDFVLEATDVRGFFTKVKEIFKNMFAAVVKAFKKVFAYLSSTFASDKALVSKYKDKITAGAETDWKAKGFKYKDNIEFNDYYKGTDWSNAAMKDMEAVKKNGNGAFDPEEDYKTKVIKDLTNIDTAEIKDMKDALDIELRGSKEPIELSKSNVSAADVIGILSKDSEAKAIKASYNKIKGSYDEALKEVNKLEKAITAKENEGALDASFAICEYYTRVLKFEKNVQNVIYSVTLKAAKDKRAQARKLARAFITAAAGTAPKQESAPVNNDLFGIKMI